MKGIITSLIIFTFVFAGAQEASIEGVLVDEESGLPLSGVLVTVKNVDLSTESNDMGEFVFNSGLSTGRFFIKFSKEGYESRELLVNTVVGNIFSWSGPIALSLTKQEQKARRKADKEKRKESKQQVRDESKSKKEIAREERKLSKKNKGLSPVLIPISTSNEAAVEKESPEVSKKNSALKNKYANIMGIMPENISNVALYEFIDSWMGTPYLMGGMNKEGIDCSAFTQRIYAEVFSSYVERSAQDQFASADKVYRYSAIDEMQEGDLVFFNNTGSETEGITHCGMYLGYDHFVHATSARGATGTVGVKISNLTEPYWKSQFVAFRSMNEDK